MTTLSQRSFTGGEISPSLYARVDTLKYTTGLRTLRNFFILRHGGVANRPGTKFVGEVKDSSKTVRLIPFVFNTDQTYMLEFGDLYMRVIHNQAYVTETALNITGATQANPCVITSVAHGLSTGDEVFISGVGGMTQLNGKNYRINVTDVDHFSLKNLDGSSVNSTSFSAYTSGGTLARIYTIVTPYLEADLSTLKFVESADVVTIVHHNYAPQELKRTGHANWTITAISFAPSISPPTGLSNSGAAGSTYSWVLTSIKSETFEESVQSSSTSSSTNPATTPVTVSWTGASGAVQYNVYRKLNGVFGFLGVAAGTSFVDNYADSVIDTTTTPPTTRNPFPSSTNYPSTVNYVQQRLFFANTDTNPETIYGSRIGFFKNFTISTPIQDDDSVTFNLSGRQVNQVKHLLDLGKPVVLTTSGEYVLDGNASGVLTPGVINPRQQSYHGSADLIPIVIDSTALFVQARGTIVRDLAFDFQNDGYRGNDLSIFSAHLFDGFSILDWTYQKIPHSIVWVVRSDGKLLGLTYIREHQIFGWHRHDFDGTVENVSSIPEGTEDGVYLVIKRTINGNTRRYVERFSNRRVSNVNDYIFMDAALSYDGRNTDPTKTMTLSGGSTWLYTETLTLTASAPTFSSTDVGNAVHLTGSDGSMIRFTIGAFSSSTIVTGKSNKTVPTSLKNIATSNWALAVDSLSNLDHIEGKDVSVFADGFVVASPNNASYTMQTVVNGSITLDKPYAVIHVGLPITADLETLDIDTTNTQTVADKKKSISHVSMHVESSRGVWIGSTPPVDDSSDPLGGLTELKIRSEEDYDSPVDLATEVVDVVIRSEWDSNGRIFVRQVDPVPVTVLSILPAGLIPFQR